MNNFPELTRLILSAYSVNGIGSKKLISFLRTNPLDTITSDSLINFFKISSINWEKSCDIASKILEDCFSMSITPIVFSTEKYPKQLENIEDPPPVLYVKGDINALSEKAVAVIGSREANKFSVRAAFELGKFFSNRNIPVVSGLALGCDTEGHRGTLATENGKTVAVLAHGLDYVYPAKNRDLADQILSKNGALVSEYAPRVKPFRSYFVQRDRLQSGLSRATIVVQTKVDGGSMHTANFCLKQNRILAACDPKPNPEQHLFTGNFELISTKKAMPVTLESDLFKLYDLIIKDEIQDTKPIKIEHTYITTINSVSNKHISNNRSRTPVQLSLI